MPVLLFLFGWVQPIIGWPLGPLVLLQIAFIVSAARHDFSISTPALLMALAAGRCDRRPVRDFTDARNLEPEWHRTAAQRMGGHHQGKRGKPGHPAASVFRETHLAANFCAASKGCAAVA
jgi:hypothetical protein